MPERYGVRWVDYAKEQRDALSGDAREALNELLDELCDNPRSGVYDKDRDWWTALFGEYGLLTYYIEDNWVVITVLRATWMD